jgi:hypothetical protein
MSLSEIFGVKVSELFGVKVYFQFWETLSLISAEPDGLIAVYVG